MKTVLRIVKYGAISIYAICGIMLLVFLVPKTGWKALNVATGSMTPAIPQGSLVIIHHTNPHTLRVGDVVTYIDPYNTKETITHRIVTVTHNGSIIAFITKGDANQTPDKEILGGNVVGVVVYHAPRAGRVLAWARRPIGLILLVIIPGLLIIIDEIRLMVKTLSSSDSTRGSTGDSLVKPENDKSKGSPTPVTQTASKPVSKPKQRPRMDGTVALIALILAVGTSATRASLKSTATLTGNTISTGVPNTNHIVIARVFIGGGDGSPCPILSSNVSIVDSNGFNQIIIKNKCHIKVTNTTNVNIVNANDQTSSSGDANNASNNGGGSASSGDASNSNSTSTTVNVDNSGHFNSGQWIELYNPTNAPVNLNKWTLHDNSAIVNTLPARVLRSHHALFIRASRFGGKFGDGLAGTGDHLILNNKLGAMVDALSWGSDTNVFNPALPMIPVGGVVERIDPAFDSDSAGDWQVLSP